MRKQTVQHHMDGLIALLLFGIFAVCVLAVLLTGADAYRRLTQRDQAAHDRRTAIQYVATRVRQADSAGGVRVEEFGGVQTLVLGANEEYITRLYCYDGSLMELYTGADAEFYPDDGERLMDMSAMEFDLKDGRLQTVCVAADGEVSSLKLSLRSTGIERYPSVAEGGAAP